MGSVIQDLYFVSVVFSLPLLVSSSRDASLLDWQRGLSCGGWAQGLTSHKMLESGVEHGILKPFYALQHSISPLMVFGHNASLVEL